LVGPWRFHLPDGRADIQLTSGIAGKIHPNPAII
jgi:hypothetical protein